MREQDLAPKSKKRFAPWMIYVFVAVAFLVVAFLGYMMLKGIADYFLGDWSH